MDVETGSPIKKRLGRLRAQDVIGTGGDHQAAPLPPPLGMRVRTGRFE
jgi:hypothetical protein